eukprot:IDg15620t1
MSHFEIAAMDEQDRPIIRGASKSKGNEVEKDCICKEAQPTDRHAEQVDIMLGKLFLEPPATGDLTATADN